MSDCELAVHRYMTVNHLLLHLYAPIY